jgi:hypothetical protein
MAHSIYGTLSQFIHRPRFLTRPPSLSLGVYFLSSRTQAFNHERNIVAIPYCLSTSALDGSREPRRDVGHTGKIGWRPPNLKPKTKKVVIWAKNVWDRYLILVDLQVMLGYV